MKKYICVRTLLLLGAVAVLVAYYSNIHNPKVEVTDPEATPKAVESKPKTTSKFHQSQVVPAQVKIVYRNLDLEYTDQDRWCLAKNIYHEARGEPREGQLAVAWVTLNRLASGQWGNDICQVVYSPWQFSWTLDPKLKHTTYNNTAWHAAMDLVDSVLEQGESLNIIHNVMWFHADYVSPGWKHRKNKVTKIGTHVFYRARPANSA